MKYRKWVIGVIVCATLLVTLNACAACDLRQGTEDTSHPEAEATLPQGQREAGTEAQPSGDTESPDKQTGETQMTISHLNGTYQIDVALQTVRVQDITQAKLEWIMEKYPGQVEGTLPVIHLRTAQELEDLLAETASQKLRDHCQTYGEDFFDGDDLLVIPRVTNTGSVTFALALMARDNRLMATIKVSTPEVTTWDMANWFLLVPVPKEETAEREVSVVLEGATLAPTTPSGTVTR